MIFVILPLMWIAAVIPRHGQRLAYLVGLAGLTAVFTAMNMAKVPYSDWIWYTEHYQMTQNYTLSQYLGARLGWITIKWNEPVYYWIARQIATMSNGNVSALAAVITIINYTLIGSAVFMAGSNIYQSFGKKTDAAMLLGIVLLAITFTLVTQLVRQEMATSFAIVGFAFFLRDRILVSFLFAILAAGTHQSAILVLLILYTPAAVFRWVGQPILRNILFVFFGFVILGLGYYISNSSIAELGRKDDGAIDTSLLFFDVIITIALISLNFFRKEQNIYSNILAISFCYFWVMIIMMSQVPLAMLRLYFTVDFIRAMAILTITASVVPGKSSMVGNYIIGTPFFIAALVYVNVRVYRSPFDYGETFIYYLTWPTTVG